MRLVAAHIWRMLPVCAAIAVGATLACTPGPREPDARRYVQPTGLAITPDSQWLFVSDGNWDQSAAAAALYVIDLAALEQELTGPSGAASCEQAEDGVVECDVGAFVDGRDTVWLPGAGAGNIAVDAPTGPNGPLRLLVPLRKPSSIVWVDGVEDGDDLELNCAQGAGRRCSDVHVITSMRANPAVTLPGDPSRITIDPEFRFAYVPHLVGGMMSLLTLDGQFGPELTDVRAEFYEPAPFETFKAAGGFAVAQRTCSVATDNVPLGTTDCRRPYLYTTHRFWPGLREFTVAAGLDLLEPRRNTALLGLNPNIVEVRPYMGDLAFEDDAGERLLVVQTTPAGLLRVDTSLDDRQRPKNDVLSSMPLCSNPNVLRLDRRERLAFVSCFADGEVAVIDLPTFTVRRVIEVGAGANDMVIDDLRRHLFVASPRAGEVSVIGIDPRRSDYLKVVARLVGASPGE